MDSFEVNRRNWDERVALHAASEDYALQRFREDPAHISDVVRFDLPRLGDITGLRAVHLQCHIGTDTVSLARLGAHVTGLDFSAPRAGRGAIAGPRQPTGRHLCSGRPLRRPEVLGEGGFDLVFTGIGALCWLPDIDRWAGVVARLMAPGARLFLREGHPVLWALDYENPDLLALEFPYFQTVAPLVEDEEQTYVVTQETLQNRTTHTWNHGLGEVVTALLERGLRVTQLIEHDSVPWNPLPTQMSRRGAEWVLSDRPERLPLTYTLQAVKP
ncbi:MAG: class I SAM-dependent methyltransferase [Micrococcales bacterium]|nr:class I SAM-dependent methyltransferase [Micrococcales bacterium]